MIDSLAALGQIGNAAAQSGMGIAAAKGEGVQQASFAETLSAAIGKTDGNIIQAEQLSLRALNGDVETREVVDTVMKAEQSLQAAIAIRDKIVTAYLEISRMSI